MKTFITALCVLVIISVGVTMSAMHISTACDELEELAEALPGSTNDGVPNNYAEFNDTLAQFNQIWQEHRKIMRFTVGHSETEIIDDALDDMIVRYTYGDDAGYMSARRKLIASIERICETEKCSADGIF